MISILIALAMDASTELAAAMSARGAHAATSAQRPVSKNANAPADEYFGPFKYSALAVRTKIDALGRSYRERWSDDASLEHDAGLIESSYRVWAQRYPKDAWLAPTGFHLAQLYDEIQTPGARERAKTMFAYVAKHFPTSKEAHLSRLRLQHFSPLHAESAVRPTPSPYGSPSASPLASGAPSASPRASGAPPPSSVVPASKAPAAPSAVPAATPAAAPGADRPTPQASASP